MNLRIVLLSTVVSVLVCVFALSQAKAVDSGANSGPAAQPATQLEVRLTGTDLYKSLVSEAINEVDRLARERSDKRSQLFLYIGSPVIGLAAFLGFTTLSGIRRRIKADLVQELRDGKTIENLVTVAVGEHITSILNTRDETFSRELAFYRLSNMATRLRAGKGFTNTERDAAVASLSQLQGEKEITGRPEFTDALEKIVDSFAAAGLDFDLDEIADMFDSLIATSPGIVQTFVVHYGMRALGDVEVDPGTMERFRKYAEACKRHNLYEFALPYLMVLNHSEKPEGWKAKVQGFIQDAKLLGTEDQLMLARIFARNIDIEQVATGQPTGPMLRSCEKFTDFMKEFQEELAFLPDIDDDIDDDSDEE